MKSSIVIGAGMVGLATAWHLQERGVEVTVIDQGGIVAGSSWGNAGWLTPGMAMPLADTSVWTYGPGSLVNPHAPLHVPFRADPKLWEFFARFVGHGTKKAWDRTMSALTPIDKVALDAFDELTGHGVDSWTREGPFIVGFEKEKEVGGFIEELKHVAAHGQEVPLERLSDPQALVPQLSGNLEAVYRLDGQRFIEPGPFVAALGDAVRKRGATFAFGLPVTAVEVDGQPTVTTAHGQRYTADSVVIATGAWLPRLARSFGVRTLVEAGRGYSFTVAADPQIEYPVYFPSRRIACTPYKGGFRIAGTMEFRGPDEPLQAARIDSIIRTSRNLFTGLDLDVRDNEWVGSRPVTPDGLPLVGETNTPGIYVAGGHGMWGMVLGPATGKFLAEQMVTGHVAAEIAPFNPLR